MDLQEVSPVLLMPQQRRHFGGRLSLPIFLTAYLMLVGLCPSSADAEDLHRPAVLSQRYDDDCGLAALRMLLERAGIDVSDEELSAGLRPTSNETALSAADLADMVKALDRSLTLDVGFLPLAAVARFAEREPFLILMKPRSFGGADAFDHFILVEGRTAGSYVVADPVLPKRARLSDQLLGKDAHGKSIDGQPYIMILRLAFADNQAIRLMLPMASDSTLRFWEQAYRLPRVLPVGKSEISISQIHQRERVSDSSVGIEIDRVSDVTVVRLARGVGTRTQLGASVARIAGSGGFRFPGETLSFDRSGEFNASLRLDHIPDIVLPSSFGISTSATLEWENRLSPSAISFGGTVEWTRRQFGAGVELDVRYDGKMIAVATPSISYRLPTKSGFLLDARIAAPYHFGANRPDYALQFSVGRYMSEDLHLGAFANLGILQQKGVSDNQFGLTLTYGVPRRFRRQK